MVEGIKGAPNVTRLVMINRQPTAPTSHAIQKEPGVQGSMGSTGPARGINGGIQVEVKKKDTESPAVRFDPTSGTIRFQTGEGAGGETSATAKTPEPVTPLKTMAESLKGNHIDSSA
jgi:hypothetical protein